MYGFINDAIGCSNCKYYDSNCFTCLNKSACYICNPGYILEKDTGICLKCHSSCS